MTFKMYLPVRILFGAGALNTLHEQALPGQKALLVISNGQSAYKSGALARTVSELEQSGVAHVLFAQIEANPLKATVEAGGQLAREQGCDLIVALGGGSVMDAAKAIAVSATNPGDLWDYAYGKTGKGQPIAHSPLPVIAITTTAATGSEVDSWGVITNPDTKEKIGFGAIEELYPRIAVVDPELMVSVPPLLTAYQGFDILFHASEGYVARNHNLMSDMYALTAIEKVGAYLPRAVADGSDLEAREALAFANTLGGVVMTLASCTAEHSLEHALSAYNPRLPHGAGLIMISGVYYELMLNKRVCDERLARMAQALGVKNARPADFLWEMLRLQEKCGVSNLKMSDYGFRPEQFDEIATNAQETMGNLFMADPCALTHEECVEILQRSYR